MRTQRAIVRLGLVALAGAASLPGCSLKTMAVNTIADTLAASGEVYASDEDPELVRDALPFSLKTIESLLASSPRHPGLLLTACSGFTSYAYAFLDSEVKRLEQEDLSRARHLEHRAVRMYLRARDYCLRALDTKHPGIQTALVTDPDTALASMTAADVPRLYWTAASWAAATAIALDQPELIADLPTIKAIADRALQLDEGFEQGAIHELLIRLEAAGQATGGSPEQARWHFERAVALSGQLRAGPYVSYAEAVALAAEDRQEFERLLTLAISIDPARAPRNRVANLVAQQRARHLMARLDELFIGASARPSSPGRKQP
jgi:predicted anti-sigma-YlaC factor YlaD